MSTLNRVIPLAGPGISALATIRLVGPLVPGFLEAHFTKPARPGRLVHGELRDESGVIDDPVVALADDGSYADLTLHGGAWVVRAAVDLAIRFGFEPARDEENPQIRFPESRSEIDAEVRLALPLARTELAASILLSQEVAWHDWLSRGPDRESVRQVLGDTSLLHLLHPPTVAIIGMPNAGKSTLANRLFGTHRSIVSPIAGTTRDWVGEEANLNGLIVHLIDTPGRRTTDDPIESQAIRQSHAPLTAAALVVVLLDATRPLQPQLSVAEGLADPLLAVNKTDLAADWATESGVEAIPLQASVGVGVDELMTAIRDRLGVGKRPPHEPHCWTERQRRFLQAMLATA